MQFPDNTWVSLKTNDIISICASEKYQLLFTDQDNFVKLKHQHNMGESDLFINVGEKGKSKKDFASILRCQICLELFVSPVITNCGHTYCEFCLNHWSTMTRYGGGSCPLCQETINSTSRNIVVEECVDLIVPQLPESERKNWLQMVEERLSKQKKGRKRK